MKDKAFFEQKLAEIRQSKDQLRANLNATEGAEQLCQQVLAEWDTAADAGLPLDQLLPGAIIVPKES